MTISKYRNDQPPLLFNNTHLSETDTYKHLDLLFHHSLSWHTHIIHLHQKVMTKINRLRSFVNLVPRHALLTISKTNILPVFDYGNIIYDNCSDYDNRMSDKAQLSAAKIILGCLKTTSSNDVLDDLNLTSLTLRRKISLLCYVSKLIFNMVPCPFPASSFRSFKEFVQYALCHDQKGMSLWSSLKKDTDRMCPRSPSKLGLQIWITLQVNYFKWKVNGQIRGFTMNGEQKTWKSVIRFPKIWNRCLNSRNNSVILSLYWFKTLFGPVARTLFRQRKWAVPSPESCVSHKDNFNLNACMGIVS